VQQLSEQHAGRAGTDDGYLCSQLGLPCFSPLVSGAAGRFSQTHALQARLAIMVILNNNIRKGPFKAHDQGERR
jgi:hypothetical protein